MSILAGLGLDVAIKCVKHNNAGKSLQKLLWVLTIFVIIILGLKFSLGNSPNFGSPSHPVLNSLRMDMINGDMIKSGVDIIDVGINRVDDDSEKGYKLVGDVDTDSVMGIAHSVTPVPGGVGPMTIAMLLHNTLKAAVHANHSEVQ